MVFLSDPRPPPPLQCSQNRWNRCLAYPNVYLGPRFWEYEGGEIVNSVTNTVQQHHDMSKYASFIDS